MELSKGTKYLLLAGFVLMVIATIGGTIDWISYKSVENTIEQLLEQANGLSERVTAARAEHNTQHLLYADHWSQDESIESQLLAAELTIGKDGKALALLASARKELTAGNRSVARQHLVEAQSYLTTTVSITDFLLGSPPGSPEATIGFYRQLEQWATNAPTKIAEADKAVSEQETVLEQKRTDQWNATKGLTFSAAYAELARAKTLLAEAHAGMELRIERGLVDAPLAFKKAEEAIKVAANAITIAAGDETNARTASDAIDRAQQRIDMARAFIQASSYNAAAALSDLAGAEAILTEARTLFNQQQFVTAREKADAAYNAADNAESRSYTPTPTPTITPTPTSTPVPVQIYIPDDDDDDSSDDGGSVWDWEDNSGSSGGGIDLGDDPADDPWDWSDPSDEPDSTWDDWGDDGSTGDSWGDWGDDGSSGGSWSDDWGDDGSTGDSWSDDW